MKTIAVMTQKGGVGKTMTAASLAYILGEELHYKVLIADGDQQGNISMLYGAYDPSGVGMPELLERHKAAGGRYATKDLVKKTPYKNIDIIPANGYLMRTNMNLLLNENEDQISRFQLAMLEVFGVYDYCIADCGLLMDMTATNILVAADLVIVPVKVGGFEVEAIANMERQLDDLRALNEQIRMRILLTMRQKNKTSLEVEKWLRKEYGNGIFRRAVRRSIVAEKSTMAALPLPKFSKSGIVTQDYREITYELLEEEGKGGIIW